MITEFVKRWGYWVATNTVRPGIYRMQEGGYLVRARVMDAKAGKLRELFRVCRDENVAEAQATLDALRSERREEMNGRMPKKQLFSEFAASRFEAKVAAGDIKSAKGIQKWESNLRVHIVPAFGQKRCDEIKPWDIAEWRKRLSIMMRDGYTSTKKLKNGKVQERFIHLRPETANTWIRFMRTLCTEMTELLELDRDPAAGLKIFDTSQSPTYTDESPNSLTPDFSAEFIAFMQKLFPQHYAMVLLGFATGKRPSTLRPIRGRGPECDVEWEDGFIRFRRSHTVGEGCMVGTKTNPGGERVHVPQVVLDALRAHQEQLRNPPINAQGKPPLWWRKEMTETDLLFPGRNGKMRSPSSLDKPFAAVWKAIALKYRLTPRAMRRTFNDLARNAQINDVVARSISGHRTPKMQQHYSTAEATEQRSAVAKVINIVAARTDRKGAAR